MRRELALLLCLAAAMCLGCEREVFRAETRLMPDGSIHRTIYQPSKRTPDAAQAGNVWAAAHSMSAPPDKENRPTPLSSLLKQAPQGNVKPGQAYFLATGQFANVDAIPDYLEFEAPQGLPKGRLVRKLDRKDLGLVAQWTWEETLTDIVTLNGHRAARREMARLVIELTIAAASDVWGPEYDLTGLKQWMETDLTACAFEFGDLILVLGAQQHLFQDDQAAYTEFDLECAHIWKRYGLNFFLADGKLMSSQDRQAPITEFINKNVQQRVRNKEGRAIDVDSIRKLTDGILGHSVSESVKAASGDEFARAWERAAIAKFGSTEKGDEIMGRLGAQVFGLYIWPLLRGPQNFDCEMTYPGVVLATNGELVGDGTVRWQFPARMAFPFGFTMRAIVVVPNRDALARHFPKVKLDSRQAVATYFDAVRRDATLLAGLLSLINNGDPTTWDEWRSRNVAQRDVLELLDPN